VTVAAWTGRAGPTAEAGAGEPGGPGGAEGTAGPAGPAGAEIRTSRRAVGLAVAVGVLLLALLLSLMIGSNLLAPGEVLHQLLSPDGTGNTSVIRGHRVPRTVLGAVVGAALGVAGALMQSLTRNPLGDPGVLGINAGAGLAVVLAVAVTGRTGIGFYLWFGFLGAGLAAVAVYTLGSVGRAEATPARLAIAGVAISAAIAALIQTVILTDQQVFNEFRLWAAGSLEGRGWPILRIVAPVVALGIVGAALLTPSLNALALGDDAGTALGVRVRRTRTLTMAAVAVLCGAATAAVGPIAFVGLGVPHLARAVVGPDQRWVLPYAVPLGAAMLLVADVIGRVLVPEEIQVGIVTALLGGPVLIALVRRPRLKLL